MDGFDHVISGEDELRELIDPPMERALRKQLDHVDAHCVDFIARSRFFVLATTGADGSCDASPRGGPEGFVTVLDEHRLAIPDYTGNRRLDSHTNIVETGRAALLFLLPGMRETLRIQGRACLTTDPELRASMSDGPRHPRLAIGFTVEEAFLQCGKALVRSELWQTGTWPEELPSAAEIARTHARLGETVEEAEARIEESFAKRLW
jgi:PPOX class probable FMN-dependent enzyme